MILIPSFVKVEEDLFKVVLSYFVKKEPDKFKIIAYNYDETGEIMEFQEFGGIVWDKKDPNNKIFLIMENKVLEYMKKFKK